MTIVFPMRLSRLYIGGMMARTWIYDAWKRSIWISISTQAPVALC